METTTFTKSIVSALSHWQKAIESHDVSKVIELYHPEAVLLGEFANALKTTRNEIIDYFNYFLSLPNLKVDILDIQVRVYDNIAIISGRYDFIYRQNDKKELAESRFSLVYKIENQEWLIVNHHSSFTSKESSQNK